MAETCSSSKLAVLGVRKLTVGRSPDCHLELAAGRGLGAAPRGPESCPSCRIGEAASSGPGSTRTAVLARRIGSSPVVNPAATSD